jgi:hypothetical protein
MAKKKQPELQLVRATINLHGLPAGRLAWADPKKPEIAELLENGWLVEETPAADELPPQSADLSA